MTRLVHRHDGNESVLATDVTVADSFLQQARGLMFRSSFPGGSALVFPFDHAAKRTLHMVAVPFDIDALWIRDDRVEHVARLSAWTGIGRGVADTVVELPAGAADSVSEGDVVRLDD
ncbi:hypothetical protein SAMN04488065_1299 [Haloplanus vescus]|uniref:DUF192 domain-containing protein n=1 Tax=Haloplanus vescus TaxID=555874 RepID=A0A1H3X245_9EURY|nr:DUF192 domain-containing protein [Haloplanus vescus]SDZ93320.1 hypothetical protein SAMN04488065_1299 [Haloplanus vescus]